MINTIYTPKLIIFICDLLIGTKGTKNFVLNQEHTGLFYREGSEMEGVNFV